MTGESLCVIYFINGVKQTFRTKTAGLETVNIFPGFDFDFGYRYLFFTDFIFGFRYRYFFF